MLRDGPPQVVFVSLDKVSDVIDVRDNAYYKEHVDRVITEPHYSYRGGKPRDLLVLDSTWDCLVYWLDKKLKGMELYNVDTGSTWGNFLVSVSTLSFVAVLVVCIAFPESEPVGNILFMILIVIGGISAIHANPYMKMGGLLKMMHDHGIREVFAKDGYSIEPVMLQRKSCCCFPKSVELRLERIGMV